MKIIDGLYSYFDLSRGVGHTSALVQGVKETVESGREVIFVTMNRDFGIAVLREAGIDISKVVVATPEDFKHNRFAGMERYPMLVDNHVMYTLLLELQVEVERLEGALAEERGAFNELTQGLTVLVTRATRRVIRRLRE
jgi:hypothetical protein